LSEESFSKYTESSYTTKLDLDQKGEFSFGQACQREIFNDEVMQMMFDAVLDGETDKAKIMEDIKKEKPGM
jgi:hypothetical protein